ncbi:hypothetical protein MHYMCMPSP_01195 [Hyalomma marginatum]|uniref:Uncharacterized protein n=1 Tax=Hyalomma marginatum TaxID=34627 RepID=A0A8S4C110_9ACAR|nr:hypothetical protein MHYMCMPASI_00189 [Hyalomma marginatum]CAG7599328.1 hypothetical protein MHYMCMPSP_01195 [Hyalomma marginatum]
MHLSITQNSVVNCQLFPAQRQDCKTIEQLWQDWPRKAIGFVVANKWIIVYLGSIRRDFINQKERFLLYR